MKHSRQPVDPESGYVLLAVLILMALLLIAMAVAAPKIAADIQRDKEQELIHRGLQYKRAIKLYYKKFARYPTSIDQLESTNNMRFLRKRYTDPMTGKDDWKIVYFGQAHVKPMGFFSQPIANAGSAGSSMLGGASGVATPGIGGSTLSSPSSTFSSSSSDSGSGFGSASSSTPGSTSTGLGSSSSSSSSNSTMGGGPMVGVVIPSTKASIAEYKLMKHYNEWEFVYDPVEDMMSSVAGQGGGGPASGSGAPGSSGTNSGTPGSSGSPTNPTNPFGNSFSNPTPQPTPQQ